MTDQPDAAETVQVPVDVLVKLAFDASWRGQQCDRLVRGIRLLHDDLTKLEATVTVAEVQAALRSLLTPILDRVHETSCAEHTRFKVCYCDCMACRPGGVCACEHCKERHPGHRTETETT